MEKFYYGVNRKNTNCIKWDSHSEEETNLLPFSIADSDYQTCQEVIDDLIERVKEGTFGYTFVDEEYLEIVKNWFFRRHQYEIKKEWIVPCGGVVTALFILVKTISETKDNVLVSTPVYNPFYSVIKNSGRNEVYNELIEVNNTYEIDFEDLEEKLKQVKIYIFCNPHNPVGRCYSKDEVKRVVELCKKYNVTLISDEIHCDLAMLDSDFYSVGNFIDEYENIVVCTAPSKTFNIAGLQNANIIIKKEEYREKFEKILSDYSISLPNVLSLTACKSAYLKGDNWVDLQRKYLTENRDIVYNFFDEHVKEAKVYKLEGTYLMWINLAFLNIDQDELINGLKEKGVIVNSGMTYSPKYKGYIRLNIACPREQLLEGLKRIKEFILECK